MFRSLPSPVTRVARIIHGALNLVWDYYVPFRAGNERCDFRRARIPSAIRVRATFQFCDRRITAESFTRTLLVINNLVTAILSPFPFRNMLHFFTVVIKIARESESQIL